MKLSPAEKIRKHLGRKYMSSDRITEHADWRDSINVFRLKVREELTEINEKLDNIMKTLNGSDKD